MFRYERPQTGRYRQFYQIGMEAIGLEAPFIDLEVIKLAYNFLQELGIENLTLAINSIGSAASREAYRQQLLAFLSEDQDDV
jgi:histidyl-tRNA synthetase